MKIINLSETNSILNQYVSEIRNVEVQNDRLRFRRNIERIGEVMAYEMSKTFAYSVKEIQTPLGIAPVSQYTGQSVSYQYDTSCRTAFPPGFPELLRLC